MDQRWTLAYSAVQRIFVNGSEATKEGTDVELTVVEQEVVDAILALIPSAATALNKLADKAYVDSSIATAAATFRGTSPEGLTQAQFLAWANALEHDNNDTVFWKTTDTAGNTLYKKYKYNGSEWKFEYDLNNSSFTAAQWAAINSGITAATLGTISDRANEGHTAYGYFNNGKLPYASISGAPTELPNPEALSWSGYSSGSYDGSEAAEIEIPNNTNQLTNGAGFITSAALSPYAQKTWVNTNFRTAAAQDDIDAILGASIQSLQSQIDAVASRDSFDELTATTLYADTLAASNVYLGLIAAGTWNGAAIADEYISSAAKWNAFVNMFEYDADTRTLLLKKDGDNARNFATYGNLASGGIGSGGGGGGTGIVALYASTTNGRVRLDDITSREAQFGIRINGTLATPTNGIFDISTAAGSVTSVGLSVPTGFSVSGSPITSSGTLALGFANGYSLPTTAKQTNWDTAYGWGNHASAGYLVASDLANIEKSIQSLQSQVDSVSARDGFDELYATSLFSDIIVGTNIYGALHGNADSATSAGNADTLDGQHASYFQPLSSAINTGNIASQSVAYAANAGKVNNHNVNTDVPAGAVFTDTHDTNVAGTGVSVSGTRGNTIAINATYQTYISHGETAYNDLTTVSNAVRSLQSQVDSVASRLGAADTAMDATFALADSAGENISDSFSTVTRALQSLQSQIDSVASRDYEELAEGLRALKMWIEDMFEKTANGIHAKYSLYSDGEIAAGA